MVMLFGIAVLTIIYAAVIAGFIVLFRRLKLRASVILGFLAFGALSGLLAAWLWPLDSSVYCNVFAVPAGDGLYRAAIGYLGDSHSAQAHETIPWILRVPQVYVTVSIVLSGLVGLPVQWLCSRNKRWQ
jgi:hypothetical protein